MFLKCQGINSLDLSAPWDEHIKIHKHENKTNKLNI